MCLGYHLCHDCYFIFLKTALNETLLGCIFKSNFNLCAASNFIQLKAVAGRQKTLQKSILKNKCKFTFKVLVFYIKMGNLKPIRLLSTAKKLTYSNVQFLGTLT